MPRKVKNVKETMDVKKGLPALDAAFLEKVKGPIQSCWDYVAADAEQLEGRLTNPVAMELCLDADRLTTCAKAPEADKLVGEAIVIHGYDKVSRYLCRHIRLV